MKLQGKQADLLEIQNSLSSEKEKSIFKFMNNLTDGGYLSPQQVQSLITSLKMTLPELMTYLVPYATQYAVTPVSNYNVGAVVHGISGAIYFGANIEFINEALSFTVHAEQASIAHAISYGETGVDYLAISAAPCGYCRQFLYEIINCPTTKDIDIIINTGSFSLTTLLPQAFGPQDLGKTSRLMLPQNNNIQITPPPTDAYIIRALSAANASYSPYTSDFSGICIVTNTNSYLGYYAENAAYNPSMSPLEAAIVSLFMYGDAYTNITRVILVEAANNKVSQKSATIDVLSSIASNVTLEYYVAS